MKHTNSICKQQHRNEFNQSHRPRFSYSRHAVDYCIVFLLGAFCTSASVASAKDTANTSTQATTPKHSFLIAGYSKVSSATGKPMVSKHVISHLNELILEDRLYPNPQTHRVEVADASALSFDSIPASVRVWYGFSDHPDKPGTLSQINASWKQRNVMIQSVVDLFSMKMNTTEGVGLMFDCPACIATEASLNDYIRLLTRTSEKLRLLGIPLAVMVYPKLAPEGTVRDPNGSTKQQYLLFPNYLYLAMTRVFVRLDSKTLDPLSSTHSHKSLQSIETFEDAVHLVLASKCPPEKMFVSVDLETPPEEVDLVRRQLYRAKKEQHLGGILVDVTRTKVSHPQRTDGLHDPDGMLFAAIVKELVDHEKTNNILEEL